MEKILLILPFFLTCCTSWTYGQDNWMTFSYNRVTAHFATKPLRDEEIIKDGKLNEKLDGGLITTLSAGQIKKLDRILTKKGRAGKYVIMECFLPRHGVVFWDKNENPIAWISICFECNQIKATPGLNKNDLTALKSFFESVRFPVHEREQDY